MTLWPFPTSILKSSAKMETPSPVQATLSRQEAGRQRAAMYLALAVKRKEELESLKASTIEALKQGVQFCHVGDVTFAYQIQRPAGRPGNVIKFSTATCHPNDNYSKSTGSGYAAKAYLEGKCVTLKLPRDWTARSFFEVLGDFVAPDDVDEVDRNLNKSALHVASAF